MQEGWGSICVLLIRIETFGREPEKCKIKDKYGVRDTQ